MGCCQAKEVAEAVESTQEAGPDVIPSGSPASPTEPAAEKTPSKETSKGGGLFGWKRKSAKKAESEASDASPEEKPSGPKREIIPASGPQAPPPGWGGTPEVEEEEEEEDDASRPSGPRAIKNIPDGNGYISGTRKDQEISASVQDRINGLEKAGLRTKKRMGRKMLTPRIITDVKETWDSEGNIKREMTHYIEEPDGTKHTKKETVHIAAGEPDPMAPPQ